MTRASSLLVAALSLSFSLGALSSMATGCAGSPQLVAADGTHRLIARDTASGVTVVLTTESWVGDYGYGEDLAIVHMLVANMGTEPILIAPGDFELHDDRGFRYVLFDPGGAFQAMAGDPSTWSDQPVAYDPGADPRYESIRTDDGELGRLALPWGVLYPGTQMRGFVYFDDVRDQANGATLIWHAQRPDHRTLADFGFPLSVARVR